MELEYEKPPILEAVIEIRLSSPQDLSEIKRIAEKLSESKKYVRERIKHTAMFEPISGKQDITHQTVGYEITTQDSLSSYIIEIDKIMFSNRAPYVGWKAFYINLSRLLEATKKQLGPLRVSRIGLRYINRLDIPDEQEKRITPARYVNIMPALPLIGQEAIFRFNSSVMKPLDEAGAIAIINVALAESPIPDHESILLDIDVYKAFDSIFLSNESILEECRTLRTWKNMIFEQSITDEARRLFGGSKQ